MTNPELTLIAALLDRTGSMESSKKATEDGFNELISAQKADPGQAIVTLAQFDKYNDAPVPEFVYQNKPINDVPKLALIPRGMTPLLDATGAFITQIGQDLAELEDNHRPGRVICVIMTDGMENASREWTWESLQALIKQQSEVYNWKFMFLGANIDAVNVAGDMGIARDAAITFNSTDYVANRSVWASTSANVSGMRSRSQSKPSFTQDQRDEAVGRKMRYAKGYGPRKLSWSWDKWLHRPTQEVVDNDDPRVPQTVDQKKKRHREWLNILAHATIEHGYYRHEMDMSTARAAGPTFTATWHPKNGPAVTLEQASENKSYTACVRHFQANFRDLPR